MMVYLNLQNVLIFFPVCFRREEVSADAKKVLRSFPAKVLEKEGPKPMPSFPDMVAYVQEKVCIRNLFLWYWSSSTSRLSKPSGARFSSV